MTDKITNQEERDIFAMAVQAAFLRFANNARLENLREIYEGVGALVRKLDRLEAAEAAVLEEDPEDEPAENVHRLA